MAQGLKIINGDWTITGDGSVEVISGVDKCLRDFGKVLNTNIETAANETTYYRYNPSYGSFFNNTELFFNMTRKTRLDTMKELIYNSIQNYLTLQESRDNIEMGEVIASIKFDAYYDQLNPTKILIPIRLLSGTGLEVSAGTYEETVA